MSYYYIGSFLISFLAVAIFVPVARRLALNAGFIDIPEGVKTHRMPTPLGGGLAVYAGSVVIITILVIAFNFEIPRAAIGIIAGTTLVVFVGLYDDYYQMGAMGKMLGEVIAALIFLTFVDKYPPLISYPAFIVLTVLWIIGIQNAINFIDNLDGMCGGISLTVAIGFGVLFVLKGMPVFAILSFALAGGALGFLRHNLPPASIFLGDGGSLLFGFALSCLGIVHLYTSKSLAGALSPILIMAFPIFDMTLVTITRLNKGRKIYVASKDHAWDMIRILGLTREATVKFVLLINLILVFSGVLVFFIEGSPFQTLIVVGFALILAFIGTQLYQTFLFLRYNILAIIVDLIAINLSFLGYYYIKYWSGLLSYSSVIAFDSLAIPLAWVNIFWIILYSAMGLYDISYERRFSRQIAILFKSVFTGGLIFMFVNYKPDVGFQISIASIAVFLAMILLMESVSRGFLYLYISARLRSERGKLNAIIVRPGVYGDELLVDRLSKSYYKIVGSVGADASESVRGLGRLNDLKNMLKVNSAARIILDIDQSDYRDLREIFAAAYYMETVVLASSSCADNLRGLKRYDTVREGLDIISIRHRRLFPAMLRRAVDAAFSILAIVVMLPFWALKMAFAGRDGRKADSSEFIVQDEKRITISRFAGENRAERPINLWMMLAVLRGRISLYGVTLVRADEYEKSRDLINGYWRRFLVKPGLFGPGYITDDPQERFNLDLAYLEQTSLVADPIMILRQIFGIQIIKRETA